VNLSNDTAAPPYRPPPGASIVRSSFVSLSGIRQGCALVRSLGESVSAGTALSFACSAATVLVTGGVPLSVAARHFRFA